MSKPLIGITESEPQYMAPFIDVIEKADGEPFPIYPEDNIDVKSTLDKLDGLLIGGGPDIHPSEYGESIDPDANVSSQVERDAMELPLLKMGMELDMPILCVCRGMQALNVVLGGKLIQDLGDAYPGHGYSLIEGGDKTIYISSEMVVSNLIEVWCFKTIILMSSIINLNNPELPTYLISRIEDLYKLLEQYKYQFLSLRNEQEVRNIVSEISAVLCLSKKRQKTSLSWKKN